MDDERSEHEMWVEKAENDRLNISNNLESDRVPWDTICFHAQQAAEKYLKAFLIYHDCRPIRTHDLGRVLNDCLVFDETLIVLRDECNRLTDYAVTARYPDLYAETEEETARAAVAAADSICEAIISRLPSAQGH